MYEESDIEKLMPLTHKSNLNIEEAAVYTGLTPDQLDRLAEEEDCDFVLWWGSKRFFRRVLLDQYLDDHFPEKEEEITDY